MAKQSLASAYVQIIPSADGISGSLAEALGGEAATAGKSSGASLGASLVSSLKGFLAAAGIGAMLKSAFTGGTEFETALAKVGTMPTRRRYRWIRCKARSWRYPTRMGVGAADIARQPPDHQSGPVHRDGGSICGAGVHAGSGGLYVERIGGGYPDHGAETPTAWALTRPGTCPTCC